VPEVKTKYAMRYLKVSIATDT